VDEPQDTVLVIAFLLTSLIVTSRVEKARSQTEETLKAGDNLQRTQAELARVTRVMTLGELTSSIAHEVNQPLAAIVINAESCLRWLDRETPQLGEARSASQSIVMNARRATEVIGRIRDLVRCSDPQKLPLDINETIRETIPLVQRELVQQGVSLRLELASTLPKVLGDRVQLQQVIINLMVNGVEAVANATDLPRELMIGSRHHDPDHVLIAVQDSGIGFDPANLDRLFTSFFTTKPGGMGMGLSICRSIIENHEGRLWASSNDGPGSTFQFTLLTCGESMS
jgi:C4-dicarboxylate-specific signal transduction histidine kinase